MNKEVKFGNWTLIPFSNTLCYNISDEIQLEPLSTKTLLYLLDKQGEVVSRHELMESIWGEVMVGHDSLNRVISQLRKLFKEDSNVNIETIRGIGYKLSIEETKAKKRVRTSGNLTRKSLLPLILLVALIVFIINQTKNDSERVFNVKVTPYPPIGGFILNPSHSPNGKLLAFSWNGGKGAKFNIYIKQEGVAIPKQIGFGAFENSPVWSPEGDYIAYVEQQLTTANSKVIIKPILGNTSKEISDFGLVYGIKALDWSPDGKWIAVSAAAKGENWSDIYLINTRDFSVEQLTKMENRQLGDGFPKFSPDGKKLLFVRSNQQLGSMSPNREMLHNIMLIDIETKEETQIKASLINLFGVDWTDDHHIIYVNKEHGSSLLTEVELSKKKSTTIFSTNLATLKGFDKHPSKNEVIIEVQRGDINIKSSPIDNLEKSKIENVISFTSNDFFPTINENQDLAYLSTYSGSSQIWLLPNGQTNPYQLTDLTSININNPQWSPDGESIIFSRKEKGGNLQIEKISKNGSNHSILRSGKSNYWNPTWSHDGKHIYFTSDSLANQELYRLTLDTKKVSKITQSGGVYSKSTPTGIFYIKPDSTGIWFQDNESSTEELITSDFTPLSAFYWDVNSETNELFYIKTNGFSSYLTVFDLTKMEEINSTKVSGISLPFPSSGSAFDFRNNKVYLPHTQEITSSLEILSW